MKKCFRIIFSVVVLTALFTIGVSAADCAGAHDGGIEINSSNYSEYVQLTQAGGTYYLTQDMGKASYYYSGGGYYVFNVTANDVTLCLNGHNILPTDRSSASCVRVHDGVTGFTLCNCQSSGGTIMGQNQRSLIVLGGASATMSGNLSLKSSLKLSESKTSATDIVQVNSGATFTMEGGSISGNEFLGTGGSTSNYVGLLWCNDATINLNGGEICNNTVVGCADDIYVATVVMSNGTLNVGPNFNLSNNTVQMKEGYFEKASAGGVLCYNSDSDVKPVLNVKGTISGNKGGIYGGLGVAAYATVTVDGARITGNAAKEMGGGICVAGGGTLTVKNAEISANEVPGDSVYGAQVAIDSYKSGTTTFALESGTIDTQGKTANALVLYRGIAAISGGTVNGTVATIGTGGPATLNVSGGTINGRLSNKELPFPGMGLEGTCTFSLSGGTFSSETERDKLAEWLVAGGILNEITQNGAQYYQVDWISCDGSHSGFSILNKSSTTMLIFTTYKTDGREITTSGKYYLKKNIEGNVTADDGTTCAINVTADNVTLCLCECSVKPSGSHVAIRCSGKNLKIVNCSTSNGVITGKAACSVQVVDGGSVIVGPNVHIDSATSLTTAPVVVEAGGSFALAGGTISSNKVTASSEYAGGAICSAGDVLLSSGTINGNTLTVASNGFGSGAVTMTDGTLTMEKRMTVSNNTTNSHGGGVVLYGDSVFNMKGGTISGNSVGGNSGGGVAVAAKDAVFCMSGGTISGNKGGRWGGGVAVRMGLFEMSGGLLKDNDLTNGAYEYGNQITVGLYGTSTVGTFRMTGGEIVDTAVDTAANLQISSDVTVSAGTATISGGTINAQIGVAGMPTGAATLNVSGGAVYGDITNAIPLPTNTSDSATTNDTQEQMEAMRKNTTINITGGDFYGALIETAHENRTGVTKTAVSGGKFADFGEDAQQTLASFLDETKGILSVMEINEGDLAYEVRAGLTYNGAYMDFGSSLDLGLHLVAGVGDCTEVSGYTLTLSGADSDVEGEIRIQEVAGIPQLFVMAHGIAAKEMRDNITFTLKKDGEVWFVKTVSVYDAAKELGEGQNEDYIAMLADMIRYGTQAQRRFNYNLRELLSKPDLDGASYGSNWTEGDVVVSGGYADKVNLSLTLKEQIELNFYIRDAQARISNVTFGGVEIPASDYVVVQATGENNAYTLISFREIPITQAKETAQFTVTLKSGATFDVNGGIASYVKLAQNDSTEGALVAALRNYVDSVYNVFSAVPEEPVAARISAEDL